jgi:hypothetical protein
VEHDLVATLADAHHRIAIEAAPPGEAIHLALDAHAAADRLLVFAKQP